MAVRAICTRKDSKECFGTLRITTNKKEGILPNFRKDQNTFVFLLLRMTRNPALIIEQPLFRMNTMLRNQIVKVFTKHININEASERSKNCK